MKDYCLRMQGRALETADGDWCWEIKITHPDGDEDKVTSKPGEYFATKQKAIEDMQEAVKDIQAILEKASGTESSTLVGVHREENA